MTRLQRLIINAQQEWYRSRRLVILSAIVALMLSLSVYVGLRLQATYRLETEQSILQQQLSDYIMMHTREHQVLISRIDMLEAFVYGSLTEALKEPKIAPPRPSLPALWQRNRDRELRERITRLEHWRMEIEAGKP